MKHLLQHFKTLTKHPQNAEELKGLILQLAIQGKLTDNWRRDNPNVESAEKLLERIEAEKKQLIKEKKIKNSKRLPIVTGEEKFFEIPVTWIWDRLGNIGNIFNGNSVNKSIKQAKYEGLEEGYPYIATKDVGYLYNDINHENGVRIPFDEPKFKVARKNTVLICSEGGSAGKKMGILEEDCCFGNKLYALEQYGKIESLFILSLYGSLSFSEAFKDKMTGIIGGISRNNFASLIIPIPPLEEQKAIVEIVNELFKEVEQLEEQTKTRIQLKEDFVTSALQRLTQTENINQEWQFLQSHFTEFFTEKENVKQLRDTILQLAVQGKLTTKLRACHPELVEGQNHASELLKRIQTEKQDLLAQKKIKKEKPLPPIEDHEKPYDLPIGWVWCRMGSISDIQRGSSPRPKGDPRYFSENITNNHWISIKDISKYSNNNVLMDTDEYLTDEGVKFSRYVSVNELIVAVSGSTTGKCCLTGIEGYIYDGLAVVRLVGSYVNPEYHLFYYLQLYNHMNNSKFGAAFPNINTKFLNEMMFPFPPLEEQKAIVEQVNSLMTLCDSLEEQIEHSQTQIEQLMQSCLREVFDKK